MLETAPNLEYSTDGVTWYKWEHTTSKGAHIFGIIALGEAGDRVYFRGNNPEGLASNVPFAILPYSISAFQMTGTLRCGGDITSLLDKNNTVTVIPAFGFTGLFLSLDDINQSLVNSFDMSFVTKIGDHSCEKMYASCVSLTVASDMPHLTHIGDYGCENMYASTRITSPAGMAQVTSFGDHSCENMYENILGALLNDDQTALTFGFPQLPITTTGGMTYSTPLEVALWMGYNDTQVE